MLLLVVEAQALAGDGHGRSEVVYERLVGRRPRGRAHRGLRDARGPAPGAPRRARHPARAREPAHPGISGSVVVDDQRGSRMAVEHLAGLGHTTHRLHRAGRPTRTPPIVGAHGYLEGLASASGGRLPSSSESSCPPTVEGGHEGIATPAGPHARRSADGRLRGQPDERPRCPRRARRARPAHPGGRLAHRLQRPSHRRAPRAAPHDRPHAQPRDGRGGRAHARSAPSRASPSATS